MALLISATLRLQLDPTQEQELVETLRAVAAELGVELEQPDSIDEVLQAFGIEHDRNGDELGTLSIESGYRAELVSLLEKMMLIGGASSEADVQIDGEEPQCWRVVVNEDGELEMEVREA